MTGTSERSAVVTGAAGFIGSTLCDRLLSDGWRVTGIDAFLPPESRPRKLRNLAGALSHDRFTLVEADTRDPVGPAAAVAASRPGVVFDLAAKAGVRPSIADPAAYVATNVVGLQNTLSACAAAGARVVFASSSSVYGDDERRPFSEDQARGRPESPYGATKIAGEALLYAHHRATGLPALAARLFTVYGPRQRPDLAIHSFARSILANEPVRLYDHGQGLRDYTYVDDAVDALVRLAVIDAPHLVVNIGSDRPIRTSAVVDELERALGSPARRELLPPQAGDVPATHADISRARGQLGWEPTTPFATGLERFSEWLRRDRDLDADV